MGKATPRIAFRRMVAAISGIALLVVGLLTLIASAVLVAVSDSPWVQHVLIYLVGLLGLLPVFLGTLLLWWSRRGET